MQNKPISAIVAMSFWHLKHINYPLINLSSKMFSFNFGRYTKNFAANNFPYLQKQRKLQLKDNTN